MQYADECGVGLDAVYYINIFRLITRQLIPSRRAELKDDTAGFGNKSWD
jgi:hypothetical protein